MSAAGALALAAAAGAHADERQVSAFRYAHPEIAAILVCPGTVAPADCDARSALSALVDPPSAGPIECGVQGQALLSGSGVRVREGQYVKVVCARDTARAD
jgi:hypothetical protein